MGSEMMDPDSSLPKVTGSGISNILQARSRGLLGYHEAAQTAVLVTLKPSHGELNILFERRAKTLRRQPGEISFPGGHLEASDGSLADAALRETDEELGIDKDLIQLLGPLDVFPASTRLLVHPFVGLLPEEIELLPNASEVDEILSISLEAVLQARPQVYPVHLEPRFPEDFPFHLIPQGKSYPWRTDTQVQYFYQFDNFVVWGLTAKVLTHFLNVLRFSKASDV